jgi:hypothetical protein
MSLSTTIAPPDPDEYHEYYETYISKADSDNFFQAFEEQPQELRHLLDDLEPGEDNRLHEPYTWTLKQLMGHLIDCERVFSNRLLRIAVGDQTPIPGIEQNMYVAKIDYEPTNMTDLLDEFEHLRAANVLMVKRLSPESLSQMGTASDNPVSAKANLYILAGHVVYHLDIIKRRLA